MKFVDSLSLTKKLNIGFGFIVFLIVGLAAFSVTQASATGGALRAQRMVAESKLAPLYVAREALDQTGIAARNAFVFSSDADAGRELDVVDAQKATFLAQLAKLDEQFPSDPQYAKVREGMHSMAKELDRPRRYRQAGQMEEFARFLVEECSPLRRRIVGDIAGLLESVEKQNNAASQLAEDQGNSAIVWISSVTAAVTLIAVLVAMNISRSLFRQLGGDPAGAVRAAASIAQGDLHSNVDADGAHPSSLMSAMKTMHNNLHLIVSNVRAGSESINSAASEITSGNLDLSNRTGLQATALEQVSASMKGLLQSVEQNAIDADSACAIVTNATSVSEEGRHVVTKVVQTMAEINTSSQRISEIVSVIDSIAFQTNILALNAAVEAARAGEQGRGFAVVASEVRSLAQRSAAAAKQVKTLISDSVKKVGDGTVLVEQAGSTMHSVVTEIQRVSELMSHISVAARAQHTDIGGIDHAIVQLDDMTQQNSALVEEAAAAAQALQQQAAELTETVQVFKLRPANSPVRPTQGGTLAPRVLAISA